MGEVIDLEYYRKHSCIMNSNNLVDSKQNCICVNETYSLKDKIDHINEVSDKIRDKKKC